MKARIGALVLSLAVAFAAAGDAMAASTWEDARAVTKEEVVLAMETQQRLRYALDAPANAVRLQAGVFFGLRQRRRPIARAARCGWTTTNTF